VEIQSRLITLPEGSFEAKVQIWEESDRKRLFELYKNWRRLCDDLISINSRAVNLPEGLSEGAFCLETGSVRLTGSINGANSSFDCFNFNSNRRIQIKACSVLPDLTSFGPNSVWDEIYFLDFFRKGEWNGKFDIYRIENDLIYNHQVNSFQTLRQQQAQGRRPRFSIYQKIIQEREIEPFMNCDLAKPRT